MRTTTSPALKAQNMELRISSSSPVYRVFCMDGPLTLISRTPKVNSSTTLTTAVTSAWVQQ